MALKILKKNNIYHLKGKIITSNVNSLVSYFTTKIHKKSKIFLNIDETKEILQNESDQNNKFRFRRILREKILKYFEEIPEKMGSAYYMNLNQINRQIHDWHGKNLSVKEIELFKEIQEELNKSISVHLTEKFEPSEKIKSAIKELKKLIKKENES